MHGLVQPRGQILAQQTCCMPCCRTLVCTYQHECIRKTEADMYNVITQRAGDGCAVSEGAFDDDLDEDEAGDPEEPLDDDVFNDADDRQAEQISWPCPDVRLPV